MWNVLGEGPIGQKPSGPSHFESPALDIRTALGIDQNWRKLARCAEVFPDLFHPDKGGSSREAKRVCVNCEVRSQCLEYAIANDERYGIWGGLSERERRAEKKRREGQAG